MVLIALAVSVADALTKAWARHALATHAVHVLGPLSLRLSYNAGASFSVDQSGPFVVSLVTALVALGVVVVGLRAAPGASTWGFGLLLGGGVANVLDRLAATPHRVTDFIALSSFSVFNGADVAITAGFIVLLVRALRGGRLLVR